MFVLAVGGILLLFLALPFAVMATGMIITIIEEHYAQLDHEARCKQNTADCFDLGIHAMAEAGSSERLTLILLACLPLIAAGVILLKHSRRDLLKPALP